MNKADQFDQCLAIARGIVSGYRAEAPEGCDPQNTMWGVAGFVVGTAGAAVNIAGARKSAKAQRRRAWC